MAIKSRVREIIGRNVVVLPYMPSLRASAGTFDGTRTDYAWWDEFRRCKKSGYQLSGSFAKPISQIVSGYCFGTNGFEAELVQEDISDNPDSPINYTNAFLKDFITKNKITLQNLIEDLYALGDQFVIVNMDGTLSVASPHTVMIEYDNLDYRTMSKVTITTRLPKATITDVYTADTRIVTVKNNDDPNAQVFEYDNLLGVIPVVHFANDKSGNELFGRPIYEGLLRIFSRYDDLLEKALDGAEIMGNPFPVFEGLENPQETMDANSEIDETEVDAEGNYRQRMNFDQNSALFLGKGGSFKFASPSVGFTQDIRDVLKSLFLLILDFTRIPEVIWGNELSSARATAEEQMKSFYTYIASRRAMLEGSSDGAMRGGFLQLLQLVLMAKALVDPKIVVDNVVIEWQPLEQEDKTLKFEWAKELHNRDLITDETMVKASAIVENPLEEVMKAQENAQSASNADAFNNAVSQELNAPIVEPQPVDASA